jgi:hypothetical protein
MNHTLNVHILDRYGEGREYQRDCTRAQALEAIETLENTLELYGHRYYRDSDCWQVIFPDGSSQVVSIVLYDTQYEKIEREDWNAYAWWDNDYLTRNRTLASLSAAQEAQHDVL